MPDVFINLGGASGTTVTNGGASNGTAAVVSPQTWSTSTHMLGLSTVTENEAVAPTESSESGAARSLGELYFDGGQATPDQNGELVWKTVLRTGTWQLRPGAGQQPVKKPLKVVSGRSSNPDKEIGLEDIIDSFNDGAIQHVTVPLSHADKVDENTGFVKSLRIEKHPTDPTVEILRAGLDFTEKDIKQKALNGSIANTSVGLLFDYQRKSDGKKYPIAMAHVCLTNRPWIDGMQPFGIAASDDLKIVSLELDDGASQEDAVVPPGHSENSNGDSPSESPPSSSPSWEAQQGLKWIESQLLPQIEALRNIPQAQEENLAHYKISDLGPSNVLIEDPVDESQYVASYSVEGETVTLDVPENWVQLKAQEKTEDEEQSSTEGLDQEEEDRSSVEVPAVKETVKLSVNPTVQALRESQRSRELRFSETTRSSKEGHMSDTDGAVEEMELSEAQDLITRQKAELEQLRADKRKNEVEDKVEKLKAVGFDQFPGLLKEIRRVYLADDGGTALLLSEDGETTPAKLSVSEAVDKILDALPKKDGKINFGEQVNPLVPDEEKPTGTNEESDEERAAKAREFLGLPDKK